MWKRAACLLSKKQHNCILIKIISNVKPNGALHWQVVADMYKKDSGEAEARNPDEIKKHWHNNLCNKKLNKPTGRSGTITDHILHCICIQGDIMRKTDLVIMGIDSDDDDMYNYNGVLDNEDEKEDKEEEDEEEDS